MKIKIIDFGFISINNIEAQTKFIGTGTYMAPEIRKGLQYDGRAVDIFSTGVVLFTMVTSNFPFNKAEKSDEIYNLIRKQNYNEFWEKAEFNCLKFSEEFKHLVFSMLCYNPLERITLDLIMNHTWFNEEEYDEKSNYNQLKEELVDSLVGTEFVETEYTYDDVFA